MRSLFVTEKASKQLEKQYDYIFEDNQEAADRVIAGIYSEMQRLTRYPRLGQVNERPPNTRRLIVGCYLIGYRFDDECVYILTVRHSAQRRI